jgi:hypothetical protein
MVASFVGDCPGKGLLSGGFQPVFPGDLEGGTWFSWGERKNPGLE